MNIEFFDYENGESVKEFEIIGCTRIPRSGDAILLNGIKWQVVTITHIPEDDESLMCDVHVKIDRMQPYIKQ